jgi:hypothetical protein
MCCLRSSQSVFLNGGSPSQCDLWCSLSSVTKSKKTKSPIFGVVCHCSRLRNASAPARVLTTFGTFTPAVNAHQFKKLPHHGNLSAFINLPYFVSLLPVSAVPTSAKRNLNQTRLCALWKISHESSQSSVPLCRNFWKFNFAWVRIA